MLHHNPVSNGALIVMTLIPVLIRKAPVAHGQRIAFLQPRSLSMLAYFNTWVQKQNESVHVTIPPGTTVDPTTQHSSISSQKLLLQLESEEGKLRNAPNQCANEIRSRSKQTRPLSCGFIPLAYGCILRIRCAKARRAAARYPVLSPLATQQLLHSL